VVHGSGGGDPQSQGAQAVFAGHAGQLQIAVPDGGGVVPDPVFVVVAGPAVPVPLTGMLIVVVVPSLHEQLQAGQAEPAGQLGQLQVQVPVPLLPVPVPQPPAAPPVPPTPPPPPAPPVPPVPPPPPPLQLQSQGGQASPGRHAGQPQVQVPPPLPLPASTAGGGGQSH
jgi:hypothetical protein